MAKSRKIYTKEERTKIASENALTHFRPGLILSDFQNVISEEISYILGLLWADGSICYKNSYSINIKLVKDDFDKIEWIFDKIGIWKKYNGSPKTGRPFRHFRASGKDLVYYLISLNYHIKSGASAQKVLNTIPEEFKKYWWRGYSDGDGYINSKNPRVEYTSTFDQDWSFMPDNFIVNQNIKTKGHKSSTCRLTGRKQVLNFLEKIYLGAEIDKIYLPRKYEKFICLKSN